jgi:Ca2+-binding EF-hand superfamily protein
LKETKIEKFTSIFKLLDSDGDNQISKDKLDTMDLPAEIIECLSPIFKELNQLEEGIDLAEFIDAAMRLYNVSKLPLTLADS